METVAKVSETDPPLWQLEEDWKALQKSAKDFHRQLEDFPHLFQLHRPGNLLHDQLNKVKGALLSALDVGYHTLLETARARNLLAYVCFRLGHRSEALSYTEQVLTLEGQQQNVAALANKAVILWHMGQRSKAQEQVNTLMKMKATVSEFPYLAVKAKAELAFSYTRFDPSFYPLALTVFAEVIPKAVEPELWLWKFGLAFTRRRMLRPSIEKGSKDEQDFQSVLATYLEILHSGASDSLKAKVYAETALLLFMPRSEDLKIVLTKQAGMSVEGACESALEFDDNDNSVLWKCGKLFRYLRKTERSCSLLNKAVSARPTSKAYHHLGLTYKALATQEKHKSSDLFRPESEAAPQEKIDPVSVVTFQQFQAQLSRSVSSESQTFGDQEKLARQASDPENADEGSSCTAGDKELQRTPSVDSTCQEVDQSTKEKFHVWKIVKSPSSGTTPFKREDPYIKETLDCLSRAVDISQWENAGAIHDIVLMFRNMGELEQAQKYLEKSLSKEHCLGIFTKINVFEQLGLTFADMAEISTSEEERKELKEKSQSMLLMALKTASESYGKVCPDKNHLRDVWQSFPALMEAVNRTEKSQVRKLQDKARLFCLIKNNQRSLDLLQDIKEMDPQKGNDPSHLKLCIDNYVELGKYEDALAFVDLLQCTSQREEAMKLFEDKHFLQRIYMQAGMQSLQKGSPNRKSHFRAVFNEVIQYEDVCTSSEDTDTEEDKVTQPSWDVHIVHEDTEQDTDMATKLASVLTEQCGLRVTRMDEDMMAGIRLEGVFNIMRRSKVVVVVVTSKQKPSKELRFLISVAARRPDTVSLLGEEGCMPSLLKLHRSMAVPSELLNLSGAQDSDTVSPQGSSAVCHLLAFLANVPNE